MSEDMSNLMNKFNSMIKNNEIPPELLNIIKSISDSNNSYSDFNKQNTTNKSNIPASNKSHSSSKNFKIDGKNDISSNYQKLTDSNNFDFNNTNIEYFKRLFEQTNKNSTNINENKDNKYTYEDSDTHTSNNNDNNFNFDINTILKMKSIIDAMNNQRDDPRANLLKSLKPYLKESRKEKVDQYIKIFSMEKVFENLNFLGGGKKNDV